MNIISKAAGRSAEPWTYQLDSQTSLTHWGAINMLGWVLMPSSFMIKAGDVVVYIDPVGTEAHEKADYIFITHKHQDHLSRADIKKIRKAETVFVCSKQVAPKVKSFKNPIHVLHPGTEIGLEDVHCQAVAAYNKKAALMGLVNAHPKSDENVGFVLTFDNGKRIYHAGDTSHVAEMDEISDIDLALLPIGGFRITMNAREAAAYANQLKPSAVVPMHYFTKEPKTLARFAQLLDQKIALLPLD